MPSISGNNKIVIKANYTQGGAQHEEGPLIGTGYPGQNVVMTLQAPAQGRYAWRVGSTDYAGTGSVTTTTKNPVRLLKENVFIAGTVNTIYADGDNVEVHIALPGDVVQVRVAAGQTVVQSHGLSANAAGLWFTDATNAAVEALESSTGALAVDTLVRARVL